jgi:hypothetical protein
LQDQETVFVHVTPVCQVRQIGWVDVYACTPMTFKLKHLLVMAAGVSDYGNDVVRWVGNDMSGVYPRASFAPKHVVYNSFWPSFWYRAKNILR